VQQNYKMLFLTTKKEQIMSAASLFKVLGLNDVHYNSHYSNEKSITFIGSISKKAYKCKNCHSKNIHFRGIKTRQFKMVPWGRMKCFLMLTMHKIYCLDCHKSCWPKLEFFSGKQRMTMSYIQYVLDLLLFGTILSVSHFLETGWDLVKDIHKNYLKKKYKKIPYKNLKYLSIDEFSIKKGHTYMTIFIDIETGRIIYATEGRTKEDLLSFLQKLASKAINLKAISMDMSVSYFSAISKALPKVDIVFDHFHVSAVINKALDEIRKSEQKNNKNIIKGKRFLLLRNYSDLDPEERLNLDTLFNINEKLFKAHAFKEQFRMFWEQSNEQEAARFFLIWYAEVYKSGIKPLIKAANTLLRYGNGLINYFKHRISNGKIEGINNKIKTMKRQAYGFRDMKYFKLRLYHLHEQKHQLAG
jgi:transposase